MRLALLAVIAGLALACVSTPGPSSQRVAPASTVPDGPPQVVVVDYGPRDGWEPGRPGAARGALVRLDGETLRELPGYEPVNTGQAISEFVASPDGRLVAVAGHQTDSRTQLTLLDTDTWTLTGNVTGGVPEDVAFVAWSPNGSALYALAGHASGNARERYDLWRIDVTGADPELVAELDFATWQRPRLSLDGRTLYMIGVRAEQCCGIEVQGPPFVAAVDVETGEADEVPLPDVRAGQRMERLLKGPEQTNVIHWPDAAMSPDGRRLYVAHTHDDRITVVDLERMAVDTTGRPEPRQSTLGRIGSWLADRFVDAAEAKGGVQPQRQVEVSPDGGRLYVTGTRDELCEGEPYFPCLQHAPIGLQVLDAETFEIIEEFDGIGHIRLSDDGRTLVGWARAYDYRGDDQSRAEVVGHGLTVIDTRTLEVIGRTDSDAVYRQVELAPGGDFAYVIQFGPGYEQAMRDQGRCAQTCHLVTALKLPEATPVATYELSGLGGIVAAFPAR